MKLVVLPPFFFIEKGLDVASAGVYDSNAFLLDFYWSFVALPDRSGTLS